MQNPENIQEKSHIPNRNSNWLRAAVTTLALTGASLHSNHHNESAASNIPTAAVAVQSDAVANPPIPSSDLPPSVGPANFEQVGHIPPSVESSILKNTFLLGNGCTANAIREDGSPDGQIVAYSFARHCNFIPNSWYTPDNLQPWTGTSYFTGSNQKKYVVQPDLFVQSGDSSSSLNAVTRINNVLVPQEKDNTSDEALGVVPGVSAGTAWKSYLESRASAADIQKLVPNKSTIYMGGWPVNQAGNREGRKFNQRILQQFSMTYVGKARVGFSTGEDLLMVVAAIPKTEQHIDRAVCSFGNSGANAVIVENGKQKILGPLSGFWGLTALDNNKAPKVFNNKTSPPVNKSALESMFPTFNWNSAAAACGFSITIPSKPENVNVVSGTGEIPGSISPYEEALNIASRNFSNPNKNRTFVKGEAVIYQSNVGKGGGNVSDYMAIKNPMISTDSKGNIYVGYYNQNYPGAVSVVEVPNSNDLVFYSNNPSAAPTTGTSSGALQYKKAQQSANQPLGFTYGHMTDELGNILGEQSVNNTPISAPAYNVYFNKDGEWQFVSVYKPPVKP